MSVIGGAGGTRTPYLFNAIEALSQMSYSPMRMTGREDGWLYLNIADAPGLRNPPYPFTDPESPG